MKINKNRVVKCLTCFIAVFMVVVSALATPANALEYLKPSDYLVEVTAEGTTKTAHYRFPDENWLITAWNSTTGVYEDFVGDAVYFPDVSYKQALFQGYPLGGPVYGSYIPWNGVVFDVSDILPGSPIDIEFPVSLFVHWETYELVDVHVEMKYGVAYYDKDGNLKDTIEGDPKYYTFSMGAVTSNSWGNVVPIGGTIPADAHYIAPYVTVDTVLSDYVPDMQIMFMGGSVDLYVDINTVIENSNMMQSINNKLDAIGGKLDGTNDRLDNIISGTPEQNESADGFKDTITDQAGQIQDSLDVMDSVPKPDASDIKTSVDSFVPETDMLAYTTPLTKFWANSTLTAMLVLVVTLAMVSFVFFGKKG